MIEQQRKRVSGVEILGLVVCIGGALIAAVVTLSIFRDEPVGNPGPSAQVAKDVISFLGTVPALLLSISCTVLGARAFLSARSDDLLTNLSGVVGTSIGLAVLLGAFSETAGGAVGAYSGGLVARYLTVVPAVVFGLLVLALPLWLTWLREFDLLFREKRKTPRSTAALIDEPVTGVSKEEAEALLPAPGSEEAAPGGTPEIAVGTPEGPVWPQEHPEWAQQNSTPTPYPEDVRLRGEIPPGAAPLTSPDEQTETSPELSDPTVQRWTPGGTESAADAPDGDLAVGVEQEESERPSTDPIEPTGTGELSGSGQRASLKDEGTTDEGSAEEGETEPEVPVEAVAEEGPENEHEANPELTRVLLGGVKTPAPEPTSEETARSGLKVIRAEINPPRPSWEHEEALEKEIADEAAATPLEEAAPVAVDHVEAMAEEPVGEAPAEEELDPEPLQAAAVELEEEEEEDDDVLVASDEALEEDEEEDEEYEEEEEDAELRAAGDDEDEEEEEEEEEELEEDDELQASDEDEDEEEDDEEEEDDDEYEYVEVAEDEEVEAEEEELVPSASAETDEGEDDEELGEDEEWEYEYVEVDEYEEGEEGEDPDEEESAVEEPETLEVSAEVAESEAEEEESEVAEDPEPLETVAEAEEPEPEAELEVEEEPELEPVEVLAEVEEEATEAPEEALGEPEPVEAALEEEPEPVEASGAEAPVTAAVEDTSEVQMDLFGTPAQAAEAAEIAATAEAQEEPVVVLQPTPRPRIETSERALVVADLILEQERVAVSMVQRRFGIDFAESCTILDELQGVGFIGPYVDGKSRDILMTREEWLAAVTPE